MRKEVRKAICSAAELVGIIMVLMAAGTSDYQTMVDCGPTAFADHLALIGLIIVIVGMIADL